MGWCCCMGRLGTQNPPCPNSSTWVCPQSVIANYTDDFKMGASMSGEWEEANKEGKMTILSC